MSIASTARPVGARREQRRFRGSEQPDLCGVEVERRAAGRAQRMLYEVHQRALRIEVAEDDRRPAAASRAAARVVPVRAQLCAHAMSLGEGEREELRALVEPTVEAVDGTSGRYRPLACIGRE